MPNSIPDIVEAAKHLSESERSQLIQQLLGVRADRPLSIDRSECTELDTGQFKHTLTLTNWTDSVLLVNRIDFESPGRAGTKGHAPFLCSPKATTTLQLEFGHADVKIKLSGFRLPPNASPVVLSQYAAS